MNKNSNVMKFEDSLHESVWLDGEGGLAGLTLKRDANGTYVTNRIPETNRTMAGGHKTMWGADVPL